jgi:hypothetical protein
VAPKKVTDWTKPLVRILEGHENLMKVTSDFPRMGKLPPLDKIPRVEPCSPLCNYKR